MSKTKKNILFMLHLPPKVHGYSLISELVKVSNLLNNSFEGRYINLILSREVHESGKTNFKKLIRFTVTSIIEAMQHSLPVITTREGGIPDMVDDGKIKYEHNYTLPIFEHSIHNILSKSIKLTFNF